VCCPGGWQEKNRDRRVPFRKGNERSRGTTSPFGKAGSGCSSRRKGGVEIDENGRGLNSGKKERWRGVIVNPRTTGRRLFVGGNQGVIDPIRG